VIGLCSGDKLRCLHAKLFIPRISTYTTKAEIEETRLKLNAERTINQNKAAAAILKDYLFQKKM